MGAGVGLAMTLAQTVNLDGSIALLHQRFGDFTFTDGTKGSFRGLNTYSAKIGVTVGFPK